MRIAMTGSSGLVGTALRKAMAASGWSVTRIVRPSSATTAAGSLVWNPDAGTIDGAGLEGHDAVLHLAGESLAGIWTPSKKRRIEDSRVRGTDLLARTLAGLESKPGVLVSWSGVDYYGDRATPVTEDDGPGDTFLAGVCVRWETAARPAADAGIRLVTVRSGLVLSRDGGLIATILPIFRLGLGAPFGSGRQPWPWITLSDMVGVALHAIGHDAMAGPVNAVAPGRVDHETFTLALARAVGRPVLLRIPAWAARLAPGGMADEMLLAGAPVVPRRLEQTGFAFRWPDLEPALKHMFGR
jgi:uncharacterized protein (TIGR01777 family)